MTADPLRPEDTDAEPVLVAYSAAVTTAAGWFALGFLAGLVIAAIAWRMYL